MQAEQQVTRERLCRAAEQLGREVVKCLRFVKETGPLIESGRLPMFADTFRRWREAEEALHSLWVMLHYDSAPHGCGRTDFKTACGVLEPEK